jgi:hypothetical protein
MPFAMSLPVAMTLTGYNVAGLERPDAGIITATPPAVVAPARAW